MKIDQLITKLEEHKAKYGNTLVRFYTEEDGLDKEWKIGTVYPVNIHKADAPLWCCMLSD